MFSFVYSVEATLMKTKSYYISIHSIFQAKITLDFNEIECLIFDIVDWSTKAVIFHNQMIKVIRIIMMMMMIMIMIIISENIEFSNNITS